MVENGCRTATVESLTAEVRTLMIGSRQITLSVAKQLDRVDAWGYGPDVIVPFGRVKTGVKVALDRKLARRPTRITPRHECYDGNWYESFEAEPQLEVIGRSNRPEDEGALIIFQVDRYSDVRELVSDAEGDLAVYKQWELLPLIVLAGLR